MAFFDPLIAGSILVLAASGGQAGGGQGCEMPNPTKINVRPVTKDVQYDYSQSLDEIQKYASDTIDPYGFHGMSRTQGLSRGAVQIRQEIKLAHRTFPQKGAACLWYDAINISIEIDPQIIIAREVKQDACQHKAVLGHELKHVKADRMVVNQYAQALGKKIYEALQQRGFKSGLIRMDDAQEMGVRMQKTVQQVVEHETKKMELARAEAQGTIDSLEEYERVAALCPQSR